MGTFKLTVSLKKGGTVEYTVSLNPGNKNYIYNVLGGSPNDNTAAIFVEELYDVAFQQLVYKNGTDPVNYISGISLDIVELGSETAINPQYQPVKNVLTIPNQSLTVHPK